MRAREAARNASIEMMIAMAAGLAAAVAGKSGAPLLGAAGVGERAWLQFSVAQEFTADHAALNMLDRACQSARGLLRFFEILQSSEMLAGDRGDFLGPHPSADGGAGPVFARPCAARPLLERAGAAGRGRAAAANSRSSCGAFLEPPANTLAAFPESDNSALARYARAIAYYRQPDLARALPAIDGLIRDFPDNPYYRELKGQMLFENGRVRDAIRPYEDAVRLAPSASLLRIALSQVYIESGDPTLNKRAIAYLNDASRNEGRDGQVWRLLATAYGRDNQLGMVALSLAEEALAERNNKDRDPAGDAGAPAVAAQHAVLSARRRHPARGGQDRGLRRVGQG